MVSLVIDAPAFPVVKSKKPSKFLEVGAAFWRLKGLLLMNILIILSATMYQHRALHFFQSHAIQVGAAAMTAPRASHLFSDCLSKAMASQPGLVELISSDVDSRTAGLIGSGYSGLGSGYHERRHVIGDRLSGLALSVATHNLKRSRDGDDFDRKKARMTEIITSALSEGKLGLMGC